VSNYFCCNKVEEGSAVRKGAFGLLFLLALVAVSCSAPPPLEQIKSELARYPEYSIILEDMKEEGNFFKSYYHRYKLVFAEETGIPDSLVYRSEITDWYKVSKKEFQKYWNYLGMVLAAKTRDGQEVKTPSPPGYQYVGNPQYGTWRRDERGNSFWEFYGKYAFFSQMFGMMGRPIFRNDFDDYRRYRSRGEPYFGRNRQYGTTGQYTKYTNKSFFERRQQRELARKTRFSEKVKQRVRRSKMSGVRRRSGGFGK
jgi:hypothetical protein